MKTVLAEGMVAVGKCRRDEGPYFQWCFEPAGQSGPDVLPHSELLPLTVQGARGAECFDTRRPLRELRDLTRQRTQLTREQTRVVNRIHKTLEDANIKLGAVASDIMGKSGRAMLEALVAGERDPAQLAELAKRRLRARIPQLTLALQGHVTEHHVFLLRSLLDHLQHLEQQVESFSQRVEGCLNPFLEPLQMQRLDQVPGLNRRTIEAVLAEIGTDMSRFPDAQHLCSRPVPATRTSVRTSSRNSSRSNTDATLSSVSKASDTMSN